MLGVWADLRYRERRPWLPRPLHAGLRLDGIRGRLPLWTMRALTAVTFALPRVGTQKRMPTGTDIADLESAMLAAFRVCTPPQGRTGRYRS